MKVVIEESGGLVLCKPIGDLDAFSVSQFRQVVADFASAPWLVFHLGGVGFMDWAGLGALVGGIRRVREHGGDAAVVCPRPALTSVLHTTGLDLIVSVTTSTEDARRQLLPNPRPSHQRKRRRNAGPVTPLRRER
jgi:anti-sigma B factor antagonist